MTDKIRYTPTRFSLDGLRRRAREIKKAQGIKHHEALYAAARDAGFANWHAAYTTLSRKAAQPAGMSPSAPVEQLSRRSTRVYGIRYVPAFGKPGVRPPTRMTIGRHRECGKLLKQVRRVAFERIGVRNRIEAMRTVLEDWLQREINDDELPGREFFDVYYGDVVDFPDPLTNPAAHEKRLYENLEAVREILRAGYPDCRPRDLLFNDIDQVKRLIARWIAGPQRIKRGPRVVRSELSQASDRILFMNARESLAYAIERLTLFLDRFSERWKRPAGRHSDEMRRNFPYAIKIVEENVYILLNRDYKPVGMATRDWAKYEDFPLKHMMLSEEDVRSVLPADRRMGLYDDGCTPWRSRRNALIYLDRLKQLHEILAGRGRRQTAA